MSKNLISFPDTESPVEPVIESFIRKKLQELIKDMLEEELNVFLNKFKQKKLPDGKQAVVRNGYHPERVFETTVGVLKVKVPRTRDRSDSEHKEQFYSALIPKYKRKSISLEEAISYLYLKGASTNEVDGILSKLFGDEGNGTSPATVSRFVRRWKEELTEWSKRRLDGKKYCYIWVDGIHFNIRNSEERTCFFVVIGATEDGKKEFIALEEGYRESAESWRCVLRDLKSRGLEAPKLAIGDGALGFWKALVDVFPETREQLCWVHKTANVLDKLPKKLQSNAKEKIHQIYLAETKKDAKEALQRFYDIYESKYPRAVNCLKNVESRLLTFYDYPAEHWQHIRTTNPIESCFATVRLRTKSMRGNGSLETTRIMVFKLLSEAQKKWKALNGHQKVTLVMKGDKFIDGIHESEAA